MKKFALILFIFLLISLNFNTVSAVSEPQKTFSEGIYTLNDLNLLPNVSYRVQNVSGGEAFISLLNSDLVLEQSIRFQPKSLQYILNPMQYGDKIVIIGAGQLSFTWA